MSCICSSSVGVKTPSLTPSGSPASDINGGFASTNNPGSPVLLQVIENTEGLGATQSDQGEVLSKCERFKREHNISQFPQSSDARAQEIREIQARGHIEYRLDGLRAKEILRRARSDWARNGSRSVYRFVGGCSS